jgi:protein ImuB
LDALPWAADWAQAPRAQRREYFIARSAQAGWLWVFREHAQLGDTQVRWYLHGVYG